MKLETFFEKFDLFADAPDAVAKMRELVLHLAVTGKLVAQDPSDEPTEKYLKRIGLKSTLSPAEADNSLPPSWIRVRFEDIALTAGGVTLGRKLGDRKTVTLPYLRVANVKRGELDLSVIKEVTIADDEIERYALRENDLLMTEGGDWDKVGRAATWKGEIPICLHQNHVFRSRMRCSEISPVWFERYFNSPDGRRYFESASKQTTNLASINMRQVRGCPVPLPPLAEQKRIVAKVDELMALCDRLEAQQQEREEQASQLARASLARFADAPTPASLPFLFHPSYAIPPADLRKSILTLAVQGKLVPQNPNDEPAETLLQRVDAEREQLVKSKKIRRQEFLGPVADDAIPFDIPASWQWRYLADVCFLITDGAHHTPQYLDSGVPFLSVKDVSGGSIDFSSTRYISEEAHRELCKRCPPERGDILLTKVGTTGIAVTVDENREFSIFVSLALLKFSQPNLDSRYLKHLINSPFVKQQSADNTQGIGNKNLVLRLINRFTVPIPPLAEQRRIVAKVEQLMAWVDALETQLAASRATAANLLSALVAELTQPL
jgi:type I restriction enzyme S subunit